ncbi:MAG: hypothetical protein P0Y56_07780 [Candidatus Andeanibacterium colombiense]|uniref:Uncharacterized protein n=1 Tax=Candidatus Andeanibacterium colombiense TaxID=3121345 RepID=A0AAJ5X935_9SPHN|nr:MAG: hypothetical protein P0Y56_07780 [Sphingomonadaceae bacterium]
MVEQTLEYRFLAEMTAGLLTRGMHYEILRGDFDTNGYDIVIEVGGVTRHIQLKASIICGRSSYVPIHTALAAKPSGCVVRMRYEPETLAITGWEWFGGQPGERLPDLSHRVARHTKANSEGYKAVRPHLRELKTSQFEKIAEPSVILDRLFGSVP